MQQMIVGMAYGVGMMVGGYAVARCILWMRDAGREARAALAGIPAMVEANRRSAAKLEELVGLFTVAATGGTPNFGANEAGQPTGPMPAQRYPLTERPVRPWDTYPTDYEAREDETEVVDTSDEELAKLEAVEEIRAKGFSVEEDESIEVQPPGVTANA